MDFLSEFAERLSELMLLKGIKTHRLAEEIGVSDSMVSYWLRAEKQISLPNFIKLADFLECTMDFLAGRSDEELKFVPQSPPAFPIALRRALQLRGMTRYSLDRDTKFKDNYIFRWDHGAVPNLVSLIELADILDVSIDYLVGREN